MLLNLEKYLCKIGIPTQLATQLQPSIEVLYWVVNKHVMAIPYQNFSLFFKDQPLAMDISTLEQRLIDQNQGGMCYETSELLYHALLSLGFDVRRVPAFVLNNKPFNVDMPSSHNISVVIFEKKIFLIDVGFGYNSLRYPIELHLETNQEISLSLNEKYQVIYGKDYIQLNTWQNNAWFSLYRVNKPFEFIDFNHTIKNYHTLLNFNGCLPIRDSYIKAGMITSMGRECFHFEPKINADPFSFRNTIVLNKEITTRYNHYLHFNKELISTLNIKSFRDYSKNLNCSVFARDPRIAGAIGILKSSKPLMINSGLSAVKLLHDSYFRTKP